MTSSRQTIDDDGRKRHLEALFADEPYLSPTMKARSMHDKLREMRSQEASTAGRLAGMSQPPDWLLPVTGQVEPAFLRAERAPAERPRAEGTELSFAEAVAQLRRPGGPSTGPLSRSDTISRFRNEVLSQWIQEVRPRESEGLSADARPELAAQYGAAVTLKKSNGGKDQ